MPPSNRRKQVVLVHGQVSGPRAFNVCDRRPLADSMTAGIAAKAALAGGRRCAPDVAPHLGSYERLAEARE